MGPSGSGKSTLLNLIAGLDTPTNGRVIVGGQELTHLSDDARSDLRLRHIGFVFQSFNLFPTFTAEENVAWPLGFVGLRWRAAKVRAAEVLEQVGVDTAARSRLPAELSGGEQQRVAIARALVTEPRLVLADEPTGNLDSQTGRAILDVLLQLNTQRGLTVIMVTHNAFAATYGSEPSSCGTAASCVTCMPIPNRAASARFPCTGSTHARPRDWDRARSLPRRPQHSHELPHPRRVIRPRPRRHHDSVHHRLRVDELRPRRTHVRRQRRVRRRPSPPQHPRRRERERRVAELRHRLRALEEVPDDPLAVRVVADVLGGAAARDHQRGVLGRIDLAEGEVRRPGVARLLCVGVVALDEVVHHELELLLRRRRDVDLVALLPQTLVGVEDLERLGGVAGQDQDLCRHDGDLLAASFADSGARAQVRPLTGTDRPSYASAMRLKKSLATLIAWERTCRVATASAAGAPHVVPVCHVLVDGKLYFASDTGARKVRNLKANPHIAVSVDLYSDDWSNLKGVLLQGTARLIRSEERRVGKECRSRWSPYH